MKKQMRNLLAALLAAAMLTSVPGGALAAEGAPDLPPEGSSMGAPPEGGPGGPPPGGPGGPGGSAGQEFATFDEVKENALLSVDGEKKTISGLDKLPEGALSEGGVLTAGSASGLMLTGGELQNGLTLDLGQGTYTIGGDETFYEKDGKSYNSVITAASGEGNNDKGYEAVYGVGVGLNSGELRVKNSYIASEGPRSTPIYAFSTEAPNATSLVVENSTLKAHSDFIWMPPFKLLAGGARATLLMTRNNSWIYGSELLSNNWGALSQDSVDAYTYMVNSTGKSTEGGYAAYLTYGLRSYGSQFYGGQYGLFMCGESDALTDTGAAALTDEAAMSKSPDFQVDSEAKSIVAAPFNAIVVHNSLPNLDMVAKGVFKNTTLSTMKEDLPEDVKAMEADDEFFMPGVDILGSGKGCGASYFYSRNLYGSLALIRSMNAGFTFDNVEAKPSNGVLLQSVVTYDPPMASGYLTPGQGDEVPGITATFLNGSYEGDILHEDYQRRMQVTVGENASLTGEVVSGTWADWNSKWSKNSLTHALWEDGYTPDLFNNPDWVADVQANLIRAEDTAYEGTENYGVDLTIAAGGTWTVTGPSTLSSLTIEEGGQLLGEDVALYVNCDASDEYNFAAEGVEVIDLLVDGLAPGTYKNVSIFTAPDYSDGPPLFTDMEESDWFYTPVKACIEAGIISDIREADVVVCWIDAAKAIEKAGGTVGETGNPRETLSRAQLAELICQAKGLTSTEGAKTFTDINGTEPYAEQVAMASAAGYISGYGGAYHADGPVTWAQLAQVIYNMYLK